MVILILILMVFIVEVIPFVEHTCRIGRQACKPIAENCADYERLRDCCCLSYLGSVCKFIMISIFFFINDLFKLIEVCFKWLIIYHRIV